MKKLISVLVVVFLTVFVVFIAFGVASKTPKDIVWQEYVVMPGDSLWNVVPHDNDYDIRDIVEMTAKYNDIENYVLIPYTVIYVPTWD